MENRVGRQFVLCVLLLGSTGAFAAPVVTSVSNKFSQGVQVSISGTGFGQKTQAKPLIWADFENTTGQPSTLGSLTSWGVASSVALSSFSYAGGKSAGSQSGWLFTSTGFSLGVNLGINYGDLIYIRFKRYSTQPVYYNPSNAGENSKLLRGWKGVVGGKPDAFMGTQLTGATIFDAETPATQTTATPTTPGTRVYLPSVLSQPVQSRWRDEEYIMRHNSSTGASDGHLQTSVDQVSMGNIIDMWKMDDVAFPGPINLWIIEQTAANNSSGEYVTTGNAFIDQVYMDKSWARVMLCDSPTFSGIGSSNTCEMQIPSLWNSNGQSIQITVNMGKLSSLSYLYVCDTTNACNQNGFRIDNLAPASPH